MDLKKNCSIILPFSLNVEMLNVEYKRCYVCSKLYDAYVLYSYEDLTAKKQLPICADCVFAYFRRIAAEKKEGIDASHISLECI